MVHSVASNDTVKSVLAAVGSAFFAFAAGTAHLGKEFVHNAGEHPTMLRTVRYVPLIHEYRGHSLIPGIIGTTAGIAASLLLSVGGASEAAAFGGGVASIPWIEWNASRFVANYFYEPENLAFTRKLLEFSIPLINSIGSSLFARALPIRNPSVSAAAGACASTFLTTGTFLLLSARMRFGESFELPSVLFTCTLTALSAASLAACYRRITPFRQRNDSEDKPRTDAVEMGTLQPTEGCRRMVSQNSEDV